MIRRDNQSAPSAPRDGHSVLPVGQILDGDVRTKLDELPAASVDCIVTSPPYFRLRNYGHEDQIGLEDHVDAWVDELQLVARGLHRVLKDSGSFWLNLGDTYARNLSDGARPKSLVLAPEKLATALVDDGWILRNKIIWAKSNPMPVSVRDRLSCTWEVLYFFTKQPSYHFDLDAIRVPHRTKRIGSSRPDGRQRAWSVPPQWRGPASGSNTGLDRLKALGLAGHPLGKNPGDVWQLPTASFRGAHHAVFPVALAERPILAACPFGGVVLDPFMGSGSTAIAAEKHGRKWIGIELNPEIAELALARIESERAKRDLGSTNSTSNSDDLSVAA
jgi:DNA modification methylase